MATPCSVWVAHPHADPPALRSVSFLSGRWCATLGLGAVHRRLSSAHHPLPHRADFSVPVVEIAGRSRRFQYLLPAGRALLAMAFFSAIVSAILGWFLARSGGSSGSLVAQHMWAASSFPSAVWHAGCSGAASPCGVSKLPTTPPRPHRNSRLIHRLPGRPAFAWRRPILPSTCRAPSVNWLGVSNRARSHRRHARFLLHGPC